MCEFTHLTLFVSLLLLVFVVLQVLNHLLSSLGLSSSNNGLEFVLKGQRDREALVLDTEVLMPAAIFMCRIKACLTGVLQD